MTQQFHTCVPKRAPSHVPGDVYMDVYYSIIHTALSVPDKFLYSVYAEQPKYIVISLTPWPATPPTFTLTWNESPLLSLYSFCSFCFSRCVLSFICEWLCRFAYIHIKATGFREVFLLNKQQTFWRRSKSFPSTEPILCWFGPWAKIPSLFLFCELLLDSKEVKSTHKTSKDSVVDFKPSSFGYRIN